MTVTLLDGAGALVAQSAGTTSDSCPPLDGTSSGPAHALAGGPMVLCVSSPIAGYYYDLAISVLP